MIPNTTGSSLGCGRPGISGTLNRNRVSILQPAQNQFQLTGFGGLLPGLSRSATNKNTRLTADHKAVTQKHTTAMVMIAVPIIPWRLDGPAAAPATRSRPINFHSHMADAIPKIRQTR